MCGALAVAGKGYLAVDLFFMLSGFVMWLNYGPKLRESGLAVAMSGIGPNTSAG